jgi:Camelysin metallo-endopeptidase
MSQDQEKRGRRRLASFTIPVFAIVAGLIVSGFLVMSGSRAAFSDTTDNTTNSLSAGTVTLTDDDSATVLFNVSNMAPGDSVTNCIRVTYSGSIADPAAVKLYSAGFTDSSDLANWLNVTIEEGDGGVFGDCTGFTNGNGIEAGGDLIAFNTTHTDYASGAGAWDPSGTPESKTYRFTFALDAATPSAEAGASVTALGFTWEVLSN